MMAAEYPFPVERTEFAGKRAVVPDFVGVHHLQVASVIACTEKGHWSWQF
jgi:hypothetical protein